MDANQKRSLNAAMKTQETAILQLQRAMHKDHVSSRDKRFRAFGLMRSALRLLEEAAVESFISDSGLTY